MSVIRGIVLAVALSGCQAAPQPQAPPPTPPTLYYRPKPGLAPLALEREQQRKLLDMQLYHLQMDLLKLQERSRSFKGGME